MIKVSQLIDITGKELKNIPDAIEDDANGASQILHLCGNLRLFTQPETDENTLITLIAQLARVPKEEIEEQVPICAQELIGAGTDHRIYEITQNARLLRTLVRLFAIESLYEKSSDWLLITRFKFIASHSEAVRSY